MYVFCLHVCMCIAYMSGILKLEEVGVSKIGIRDNWEWPGAEN